MEANDAIAVEQVRRGDVDAFRLLVERHSRAVFRLAYRLTRNEHDADDVVQETFLRAYKHLPTFDARSSFGTWLHRIATNSAFDLLRKRQHERSESLEADRDPVAPPIHDSILTRVGVTGALQRGMKELSENERIAFVLRHYEGMSIEEIGQFLGTEANATKNTIFRAVKKLRVLLEPLVRTT